MLLVLDRDPSQAEVPGFAELEGRVVKLLDRVQVSLDLAGQSFEAFEREALYPFLKLLAKKFLSYFVLKKLVDIALQCNLATTAEKISGSLRQLEKKLFKNNQLHRSSRLNAGAEPDLEAEMKKKFGFDVHAQGNGGRQKENQRGLFKKKAGAAKTGAPVKRAEAKSKAEASGGNRSSLFYKKFIKKSTARKPERPSRGPLEEATHKKVVAARTRFRNGGARPGEEEVPDFYRLHRLISQNRETVIDLSQAKPQRRLEALRRERLKNRELPHLHKPRAAKRRLKRSFNYTARVGRRKRLGDQNDENIINLQSRADILFGFEKEMIGDLQDTPRKPGPRQPREAPKVIGVPSEADCRLLAQMKRASPSDSLCKLGPNFESFALDGSAQDADSRDAGSARAALPSGAVRLKGEAVEGGPVLLAEAPVEGKAAFASEAEKLTNKKLEEVSYEIGSDDWENNVFGKHTPTKDFLRSGLSTDLKT